MHLKKWVSQIFGVNHWIKIELEKIKTAINSKAAHV